jgi:hypothetical protein
MRGLTPAEMSLFAAQPSAFRMTLGFLQELLLDGFGPARQAGFPKTLTMTEMSILRTLPHSLKTGQNSLLPY